MEPTPLQMNYNGPWELSESRRCNVTFLLVLGLLRTTRASSLAGQTRIHFAAAVKNGYWDGHIGMGSQPVASFVFVGEFWLERELACNLCTYYNMHIQYIPVVQL